MNKLLYAIILSVVATSLVLVPAVSCAPSGPPAEGKVIKWRMASTFGPGDFSADLLPVFANAVKEKSKGRLEITTFYGDEVVPFMETWPSVEKGILDAAQTCGAFWSSTEPTLLLEAGLPFSFRGSYKDVRKIVDDMGLTDTWRAAYARHNIELIDIHCYGPYAILCSNKPIRKLDDFKGVKIRAIMWWGDLYRMLGASTGFVPGSEVYMALKMKTYDAAVYSIDAIRGMKWQEVMDYLILPWWVDWYWGDIIVNKKTWDSLPDDLKKAVKDAAKEYADANLKKYTEEIDIVTNPAKAKELGYEVITLPAADVDKIRDMTISQIWPEIGSISPELGPFLDKFKQYWGSK
jgi:TRAP-type C4-dicarboxylate transport system substrate-binding protein